MIQGLFSQGNHREQCTDTELAAELFPLLGLQSERMGWVILGWGHTTSLKLRGCQVDTSSDLTLLPPPLLGHCTGETQEARARSLADVSMQVENKFGRGRISTVYRNKHPVSFEIHYDCICNFFHV